MSYPIQLDEYDDDTIIKESMRRRICKRDHECFYCGKRLDSGHSCKLNEHDTPVPADFAQEAVLQTLAAEIDRRLPNRRGFVLIVTRFGEEGVDASGDALASYVSSLKADEVPEVLEGMASYIRKRELQRNTFFESAPETLGPCIHCGYGIFYHTQDSVSPTRFACPPKEKTNMSQYVVTFDHPDQDMHIRAANKVGREPDSHLPHTSVWDFGEDELPATQAEARLRGDQAEITCEKHEAEVSSGGLPEGGAVGTTAPAASSPAPAPTQEQAEESKEPVEEDADKLSSAPPQGGGTPLNPQG